MKPNLHLLSVLLMSSMLMSAFSQNPTLITDPPGATYCEGSDGVLFGVENSENGIEYILQIFYMNSWYDIDTIVGDMNTVWFYGNHTVGQYRLAPPDSAGNEVTVVENPSPEIYNIVPQGLHCPDVEISLNNCQPGVEYILYRDNISTGIIIVGTGGQISFGVFSEPGEYYVEAINNFGCSEIMQGTTIIMEMPAIFEIIPIGIVCGETVISLSGSQSGVYYQLYLNGNIIIGTPIQGNGMPMSFGMFTMPGVYTIEAYTDDIPSCSETMNGSCIITDNLVADFSFAPSNECSSVPVQFTDQTTGGSQPYSYSWYFDDPNSTQNTSTLQNPSYQFNAYGNGTQIFEVALSVTDSNGCYDSIHQFVTVMQRPDASLVDNFGMESPWVNCNPDPNAQYFLTVNNTSTTIATNVSYTINWGEGPDEVYDATFTTASHNYTTKGSFVFILTVVGENGCSDTLNCIVYNGSTPSGGITFEQGALEGCVPHSIVFYLDTAAATNDPSTEYCFDWGDGTPVYCFDQGNMPPQNPDGKFEIPHTYYENSCSEPTHAFVMSMIVSNPCSTIPNIVGGIKISRSAAADFDRMQFPYDPIYTCANIPHQFENNTEEGCFIYGSNAITTTNYYWDFGEPDSGANNTSTLLNPSHQYDSAGIYTVTLIAHTADGIPGNCAPDTIQRFINVYESPIVDAGPDQFISIDSSAQLSGSVAGGEPPYTYYWEPDFLICSGQGTLTPTTCNWITSPTLFTLTVSDDNGCIGNDEVWVIIDSDLSVNPTANPDTICFGESIQLYANASGGTGNYTYYWTPPDGLDDNTIANPIATPIAPGNYFYQVIVDDGQNVVEGLVELTVDPLPYVYAGTDTTICANSQYQVLDSDTSFISIFSTGVGYGSYNGVWALTDDQLHPTYIPNIEDPSDSTGFAIYAYGIGACSDEFVSDIMFIYIHHLPEVYAGADATICENMPYEVPDANVDFSSSFYWEVLSGSGFLDGYNDLVPTYFPGSGDGGTTVQLILCANGIGACEGEVVCDTINIYVDPLPEVYAGINAATCENTPYQIPGATIDFESSFQWGVTSGYGTLDIDNIINPTYTPGPGDGGTVVTLLLCAYGIGACSDEMICDEMAIYIAPLPEVFAGEDGSTCENGVYFLNDFSINYAESHYWEVLIGNGIIDDVSYSVPIYIPGIGDTGNSVSLVLSAIGEGGYCEGEIVSDTINIYVDFAPTANFTFENACVGAPLQFTDLSNPGTGGMEFWWWSFGDGYSSTLQNPEHIYTEPGIYTVELFLANTSWCYDTIWQTITIYELPDVSLESFDPVCLTWPAFELYGGLPEEGIYTGDGVVDNWFYPETAGLGTHIITYTYEDINGCVDSDLEAIYVDPCTGVPEQATDNKVLIYPNPSNGSFNIELTLLEPDQINIQIFNLLNELVYRKNDMMVENVFKEEINLFDQPDGLYYVLISGQKTHVVKKIILQ